MLRLPRVIMELAPASILRRDAELAWNMLEDPDQSALVLVSLPEELPTNETIELAGRITGELGLPIGAIVQNRVRPLVFTAAERDALGKIPPLEPRTPVEAALDAAAARAIRERAQLDSRTRLARLNAAIVELPEGDPALPPAELSDALAQALA
jgi:hypothetical protein